MIQRRVRDGNSAEQEILGIPTRIEIGPKDIENNQVVSSTSRYPREDCCVS